MDKIKFSIIICILLVGCAKSRIQQPISDVPVITEYPIVGEYRSFTVDNFEVKVLYGAGYGELNLYNNEFLVEFELSGKLLANRDRHFPRIEKVYISEFIDTENVQNEERRSGRIVQVYPIAFYDRSKQVANKETAYTIKVQRIFKTIDILNNEIKFVCRDKERDISVFQAK